MGVNVAEAVGSLGDSLPASVGLCTRVHRSSILCWFCAQALVYAELKQVFAALFQQANPIVTIATIRYAFETPNIAAANLLDM